MYHLEGDFNGSPTLAVGIFDFGLGFGSSKPVLDFGARGPSPLKAPPTAADEGSPANFGVGGVLQVISDCALARPVLGVGATVTMTFRNTGSLVWTFQDNKSATLKFQSGLISHGTFSTDMKGSATLIS